jgi:hypothetical protein
VRPFMSSGPATYSFSSFTKPTAGTPYLRTASSSVRVISLRLTTSLATTPAGDAGRSSKVTATARSAPRA